MAVPYMKLYWGAYHKDTRHLNRSQHGAYFLLIGEAWQRGGGLPDDDKKLAAWALCTPDEWAEMKPTIMEFFNLRRGKWWHDKVREELATYESISRKRKEAGKKGGEATRGNIDGNIEANAKPKPTKSESKSDKEIIPPTSPQAEQKEAAPDGAGGGDSGPSKSVDMPKWMEPYFEKWWSAYPLKKRKLQARPVFRRAWAKIEPAAGKEGPEGRMATLMAGTAAYVAEIAAKGTTPDKIAHPTTWLNGGGWADEYQATGTLKPVEQRGALY